MRFRMKIFDVSVNILDDRLLFSAKKKDSFVTEVAKVPETLPVSCTPVTLGSHIVLFLGVVQLVVLIVVSQTPRFSENVLTPAACIILLLMPICTNLLRPRPVPARAVFVLLVAHDMAIGMLLQMFSPITFGALVLAIVVASVGLYLVDHT
jgi:hypothetical protein